MELNNQGGILIEKLDELKRAKEADLVTLPRHVAGTNCFNCKWIRNTKVSYGHCSHPKVMQYVTKRQCCALWDNVHCFRQFEGKGKIMS